MPNRYDTIADLISDCHTNRHKIYIRSNAYGKWGPVALHDLPGDEYGAYIAGLIELHFPTQNIEE